MTSIIGCPTRSMVIAAAVATAGATTTPAPQNLHVRCAPVNASGAIGAPHDGHRVSRSVIAPASQSDGRAVR